MQKSSFSKISFIVDEKVVNISVLCHDIECRSERIAGRPYRKDTTDGIHHGWDVYADIGTPVAAIDDGYILRKVSEFDEGDFARIDRAKPITPDKQIMNLDIFRGNQVWLLTDK